MPLFGVEAAELRRLSIGLSKRGLLGTSDFAARASTCSLRMSISDLFTFTG